MSSLDSDYQSSDGFVDEYTSDEGISVDDLLRNKLDRIMELELESTKKEKEMANMRHTVVATEVKRKKEVYLLKLELETCRREKDASEERMAEIYEDMLHLVQSEPTTEDTELEAASKKYQQIISIRDNQLQMLQTSCREVVKTLKEEVEDLMEDRQRMELDLLNQLSSLDDEKRETEAYLMRRVEEKDEAFEMLRRRGGNSRSSHSGDIEELENEISTLLLEKKNLQEAFVLEQEKSDEEVKYLEHSNTILEEKIQALAVDIAVLRAGNDGSKMVDTIAKREEELSSFLDKVAGIRDQTDQSIQNLKETMDKAKSTSAIISKEDTESLLSTLVSASLVHDQVKISFRLIEVQLQNRLKAIRNEKFGNNGTTPRDTVLLHKMKEIQAETIEAISKVEVTLSQQIYQSEGKTIKELRHVKSLLEDRTEALQRMQDENDSLQREFTRIKGGAGEEGSREEEKACDTEMIRVNKQTIDQLEIETLRIVHSVQMKNETIQTLSNELSRHRILEKELTEQLDRLSAFPSAIGGKNRPPTSMTIAISKHARSPEEKKRKERTRMPRKGRKIMIAPLRPSSRELNRYA